MAEIHFMPVCSNCGTILPGIVYVDAEAEPIPYANYELYAPTYMEVHPRRCPRCNHIFSSILMPTKLPFRSYKSKEEQTDPCTDCRHYPPSSTDGKPCCICDPSNPLTDCREAKEET